MNGADIDVAGVKDNVTQVIKVVTLTAALYR